EVGAARDAEARRRALRGRPRRSCDPTLVRPAGAHRQRRLPARLRGQDRGLCSGADRSGAGAALRRLGLRRERAWQPLATGMHVHRYFLAPYRFRRSRADPGLLALRAPVAPEAATLTLCELVATGRIARAD